MRRRRSPVSASVLRRAEDTIDLVRYLDHVLIATDDIDGAIARLRTDHGLGALERRSSPVPGVVNVAIPLAPPTYLELVMATDPTAHPAAADLAAAREGLFTWAIEAEDLDAVAEERAVERCDYPQWSVVSAEDPGLPFFIRYNQSRAERLPYWTDAYARAAHECAPGRITAVRLGGESAAARRWVGEVDVPVLFGPGRGTAAVVIETAAGPITLA
jgi:hypothetical protein